MRTEKETECLGVYSTPGRKKKNTHRDTHMKNQNKHNKKETNTVKIKKMSKFNFLKRKNYVTLRIF